DPSFSPDGSKVVFVSKRNSGGVYVISTLGGEEQLVAEHGAAPHFSPDGKWIAYSVGGLFGRARIYIVSSTGGKSTELKLQIPWAAYPIWSPDGKHLLFMGSTDPHGFWLVRLVGCTRGRR